MKFKNILVCLLLSFCLLMTGCRTNISKTIVTVDEFNNAAVNQGFVVYDNTELYDNVNYIVNSTVAVIDDLEIEMVEYIDSEHASKAQENHIESFKLLKTTGALVNKNKGINYYSYSLVSNNRYMISTRVDNTLIFCKVMLTEKDKVTDLLNELGY